MVLKEAFICPQERKKSAIRVKCLKKGLNLQAANLVDLFLCMNVEIM